MRRFPMIVLGALCLSVGMASPGLAAGPSSSEPEQWSLRDGDRVALIGGTFIEREQRYGYLETALTIANPDKKIIFRNLGWSGDTIGGVSRSGFDPPEAGFKQLIDQVNAVKPTVIIAGYGANEAFAGKAGLDTFVKGYERLLEALRPIKARVILLAPLKAEKLPPPLPDPAKHNQDLELYTNAIQGLAKRAKATFVMLDPFDDQGRNRSSTPLTDDGIHLTDYGYWQLAKCLELDFQIPTALTNDLQELSDLKGLLSPHSGSKRIEVPGDPEARVSYVIESLVGIFAGTDSGFMPFDIGPARRTAEDPVPGSTSGPLKESIRHNAITSNEVRVTIKNATLPLPAAPTYLSGTGQGEGRLRRFVKVKGLEPGRYTFRIDCKPLATAAEAEWAKGMRIDGGPEIEQVEQLRQTIIKKNELFFHRWRPQNITYLLGFRKHEQGNNAVEIPQFDPLVAEQEEKIAVLKKPVPHVYELTRDDAKGAAK